MVCDVFLNRGTRPAILGSSCLVTMTRIVRGHVVFLSRTANRLPFDFVKKRTFPSLSSPSFRLSIFRLSDFGVGVMQMSQDP